jgi:hypothetical protein
VHRRNDPLPRVFVGDGEFDWPDCLVCELSYCRFLGRDPADVLSRLFELMAQFPIRNAGARAFFARFLFLLFTAANFDYSHNSSVIDMIQLLAPDPAVFLGFVADLVGREDAAPVVSALVRMVGNLAITAFDFYPLLLRLPCGDLIALVGAAARGRRLDELRIRRRRARGSLVLPRRVGAAAVHFYRRARRRRRPAGRRPHPFLAAIPQRLPALPRDARRSRGQAGGLLMVPPRRRPL